MKKEKTIKLDCVAIHNNYGLVKVIDISKKFAIAKISLVITKLTNEYSQNTFLVPLETLSPCQ